MENIRIKQTGCSPEIDFNFDKNIFSIRGESYPENIVAFFNQPLSAFESYLNQISKGEVEFNFQLIYFNSSSAKIIMKLFTLLDQTAKKGVSVTVNWYFDTDDDSMEEMGEEFGEDLESAAFNLVPVE